MNAFVPRVDTGGIEDDAATEEFFDSDSSGSMGWTPASDEGGVTTYLTINSVSWTNSTGSAKKAQIDHNLFGYHTSAPATAGRAGFSYQYTLSGGGSGAIFSPNVPIGASNEGVQSYATSVSVPNGQTITVTLKACALVAFGSTVTVYWRDAKTRMTAIKR
jgi:hypothetical protein